MEDTPRDDEKFKLTQKSDLKKINIEDLPIEEQEKIREFMETIDDDEEPGLYIADFTLEVDDLAVLPLDFIASSLRDAINEDNFEDAADYRDEIKKRGYEIEVTREKLVLTLKNNG